MKTKHITVITAALVAIAAITVIATDQHEGSTKDPVFRLKSNGQVVAEIRILARGNLRFSSSKIVAEKSHTTLAAKSHTTWTSTDANRPVTATVLLENGQPVVFSAEEIESDASVDVDPKGTMKAK
jgi:hypothetical protein